MWYDAATTLFAHDRHHSLACEEGSGDIDGDHLLEYFPRVFTEGYGSAYPGVVDEHVDPCVQLDGRFDHLLCCATLGQVEHPVLDTPRFGVALAFLLRLAQLRERALGHQEHRGAGFCVSFRDGVADPGRRGRAGHDGDFAC